LGNNSTNPWKQAFFVGLGTFFVAIAISAASEIVVSKFHSILLAFILLIIIIFIGIIFDMIGVAATAAEHHPFHAKGAKRVRGSQQSIMLVANADKVANFSNDLVGDIASTVSGALGAAIIFEIATSELPVNESLLSLAMTGLVAALTVGGKAAGKKLAIDNSEEIIFRVGQVLAKFEELTGIKVFSKKKTRRKERR